jgi:UDP-galactopyranose mutase
MTTVDYLIVGSGLCGATIARHLKDSGKDVLVLEKRTDIGGNCADTVHESGQRYSLYGPHYFRTNNPSLWGYAHRFGDFLPFEAVIKSSVDGILYDYPITQDMINALYPDSLWSDDYLGRPDFEGECLRRIPRVLYDKFVKSYTEKQWQKRARDMDISLASRVEVRKGSDRRLSTKKYQGVPVDGYTQWIANMLDGIPVERNVDYLQQQADYHVRKHLVFTGAIDAYFGYKFGRLQYRSQSRIHSYLEGVSRYLPVCQVNCPSPDVKIIREIEWKHIWPNDSSGTLVTSETPRAGGEEYPVPAERNNVMYRAYREWANSLRDVTICGRLGEFSYYDMDQIIARSLKIVREMLYE